MKKIIIGLLFVGLIVGYYYYLSHRTPEIESNPVENAAVERLVHRNLDSEYYPEFPRDVVDFYSQVVVAYYENPLTDEQIEALGKQARKLFDEELLERNPENEFLENLKNDISEYNTLDRKIYNYNIERARDIDLFTFEGKNYAKVSASYSVKEKTDLAIIYQDYTLRKGEDGHWHILFWESIGSVNNANEQ